MARKIIFLILIIFVIITREHEYVQEERFVSKVQKEYVAYGAEKSNGAARRSWSDEC